MSRNEDRGALRHAEITATLVEGTDELDATFEGDPDIFPEVALWASRILIEAPDADIRPDHKVGNMRVDFYAQMREGTYSQFVTIDHNPKPTSQQLADAASIMMCLADKHMRERREGDGS